MHAKAVFENAGRTLVVKVIAAGGIAVNRSWLRQARDTFPEFHTHVENTIQYRLSFIVQGAYFTSVYAHDTLLPGFNGQRTS